MRRLDARWVPAVLLIMAALGYAAILAEPAGGVGTGLWPVGLATACLVLTPHRLRPPLVLAVAAVAIGTIVLGERSAVEGLGFGSAIVAESLTVWWLLVGSSSDPPSLRTDADLRRFLLATVVGTMVGAAISGVTAGLTDMGAPWRVAGVILVGHLMSQLTVVPFVTRLSRHSAVAHTTERALQWVMVVLLPVAVFTVTDFPSLAVLLIPLLAWGAARSGPVEALVQQGVVLTVVVTFTSASRGPFADIPELYGLPADTRTVALAAFGVSSGLIVLPLILRVGEQMAAARRAATERDLLRRVLDGTFGVAIIGSDATGRITLFNPGAERLLGYSAATMLGHPTASLHTRAALSETAAALGVPDSYAEVVQAVIGKPGGFEIRCLRADGSERDHEMTLSALYDHRGEIIGYVATSEDVTEQRSVRVALEEAVDRLRRVDAMKDAFVSNVSHELRTPITSILGYLELLRDGAFGGLEGQQADAIRRVADNSSRLLRLIEELLTLSRMDNDSLVDITFRLDLRGVVRTAYDALALTWAADDRRVSLHLPRQEVPVVGDADMLERVVTNLVGNAVKFTPVGGEVGVELATRDDEAVLTVSDTGIGIPAAEFPQLFDRFFRSSNTAGLEVPGSGLGLAIADAIVTRHGGSIEVSSTEGVGTTFAVHLPLAPLEDTEKVARSETGPEAEGPAADEPEMPSDPGNIERSTTVKSMSLTTRLPDFE